MRKLWLTVLILLSSILPLAGEIRDDYNLHYNFLNTLPSRGEGSPQESRVFRYIMTYAQKLEVETRVHTFGDLEGAHSYSSTIEIIIPGEKPEEIVYLFPTSQPPFSTKKTLSGSLALGITLMPLLANQQNKLTTRVVFVGADREDLYLGSQEYLRVLQQTPTERQFIYTTFDVFPETIGVSTASNGITTPLFQLEAVAQSFRNFDVPTSLQYTQNQLQRLRLEHNVSPLKLYLETGSPAIQLTPGPGTDQGEDPSNLIRALAKLPLQEMNKDKSERNYLAVQTANKLITIREQTYIFVVGGLFLLFLIIPFLRKRKFFRYVLSVRHHIGSLIAIIILGFLAMILGGTLLLGISNLRGIQRFYTYTPLIMLLFKLSLATLAILLLKAVIPKRWIVANNSFYSASALFILVIVTLGVTLLDITLSLYFFIPLIFASGTILSKQRWLKILCFMLSLGAMVGNVILLVSSYSPRVYYILTLSPKGTILETLLLLPYGLLLIRLMQRDIAKNSQASLNILALSFSGVLLIGTGIALMVSNPFSKENPMAVVVTQTENATQGVLLIEGEAPLAVTEKGEPLKSSRNTLISSSEKPLGKLQWNYKTRSFLSKTEHTITIESPTSFSQVNAFLDISRAIPVIYDTNFPFSFDFENNQARFFIGPNPPNPLEITFTLAQNATTNFRVEAIFHGVPIDTSPYIENPYREERSKIISIVDFPIAP